MNSDDGHPFSNFDVNIDKHHFLTLNHHSTASLQRCFSTHSPEPSTTTFPAGRGIINVSDCPQLCDDGLSPDLARFPVWFPLRIPSCPGVFWRRRLF